MEKDFAAKAFHYLQVYQPHNVDADLTPKVEELKPEIELKILQ
jgi:hypothetical protein